MTKYLEPWVSPRDILPIDGESVLVKSYSPVYRRYFMQPCVFRVRYGVHVNAFVIQEYPLDSIDNKTVDTKDGYVRNIDGIICWMPIPPHIDNFVADALTENDTCPHLIRDAHGIGECIVCGDHPANN